MNKLKTQTFQSGCGSGRPSARVDMYIKMSTELKGCVDPFKERWRAGSRKGLTDISHRYRSAPTQSPPPRGGRLEVSLDSFSSCVWARRSFPPCAFNSLQTQARLLLRTWGCRWTIRCWLCWSSVPLASWCLHYLGVLIIVSTRTLRRHPQCLGETTFFTSQLNQVRSIDGEGPLHLSRP